MTKEINKYENIALSEVEGQDDFASYKTEERIIAIVRLVAMLASTAATAFGFAIDANIIAIVLLCACAIGAILWGWWFNSNMTTAAAMAQRFLNAIKSDEKGKDND